MFIQLCKSFLSLLLKKADSFFRAVATALVFSYKILFSGYMGWSCRFYPTCSSYALECYRQHSFIKSTGFCFKKNSSLPSFF